MNCLEFRRVAGADPGHLTPEAVAHGDECPACAQHLRDLLAMDATIRRALQVPAPQPAESRGTRSSPIATPRQRWLALAASLVAGVLVGSVLWIGGPRASLAREVVEHARHEPQSFAATHADPEVIDRVLRAGGIRLRPGAADVTYASSCPFRDRIVPHLVVRTAHGPVTVLVLRGEPITRPIRVREGSFRGTLVPAGPGSIAVFGDTRADLSEITERLENAVEWLEPPGARL
jgi:hypothetical protein